MDRVTLRVTSFCRLQQAAAAAVVEVAGMWVGEVWMMVSGAAVPRGLVVRSLVAPPLVLT